MGLQMDGSGGTMNWDQNKELVEQILRTGMYAKLYDEETTYGYLTYLTYRVEDALFTWKKESDVDGFWADLTWEEYIAVLRREKSLVLAAQRVLLNTVIAFPASAFDFTLEEAEVDFPVTRYDSAGMLHMAKLYSFENYTSIVEFLMFRAERAYYLLRKKQRGPHYTWELYIVELLHSQREFVDPLSRAFRNALAQLNFLPAWQVIYPTIQEATEIE